MELTPKEIKFLTIMNETRLCDNKMFRRDSEAISKIFTFDDKELGAVVKKLVKMDMLSVLDLGGNEKIYFHTDKVSQFELDKELKLIKR
jgi:hypothetical protein